MTSLKGWSFPIELRPRRPPGKIGSARPPRSVPPPRRGSPPREHQRHPWLPRPKPERPVLPPHQPPEPLPAERGDRVVHVRHHERRPSPPQRKGPGWHSETKKSRPGGDEQQMPENAQAQAQIGVTGLGVMGRNLARNFARHGYTVALHNRTLSRTTDTVTQFGHAGTFVPAQTAQEFVQARAPPPRMRILVNAGEAPNAASNE